MWKGAEDVLDGPFVVLIFSGAAATVIWLSRQLSHEPLPGRTLPCALVFIVTATLVGYLAYNPPTTRLDVRCDDPGIGREACGETLFEEKTGGQWEALVVGFLAGAGILIPANLAFDNLEKRQQRGDTAKR